MIVKNILSICLIILTIVISTFYCFVKEYQFAWIHWIVCGFLFILSIKIYFTDYIDYHDLKNKVVVITGCDTGIGLSLTSHLCKYNAIVFAGCLYPQCGNITKIQNKYPNNCYPIKMDVSLSRDVTNSAHLVSDYLSQSSQTLWALINNAGVQLCGDVELLNICHFERLCQVNFLGMVRTCQEFLPLLRFSKGRVINVSSVRGRHAWPLFSAYTCTKWAVEALTDTLRRELYNRFEVPVVLIEPGHFGAATESTGNQARVQKECQQLWNSMSSLQRQDYGFEYIQAIHDAVLKGAENSSLDLAPVIKHFCEALLSDRPRDRYMPAGSSYIFDPYKLECILSGILPVSLMDYYVHLGFKKMHLPLVLQNKNDSQL